MSNGLGGERRRTRVVLKGFQTKFIIKYVSLLMAGTFLFSILLYFFVNRTLGENLYEAHLAIESTGRLLLPYLILAGLLSIVIVGIGSIVMTLYISHRIAGPLYRVQVCLEELRKGDLTVRAHFRNRDQVFAVADTFNQFADQLAERVSNQIKTVDHLGGLLEDVRKRLEAEVSVEDLRGLIYQMSKSQERLVEELNKYKL